MITFLKNWIEQIAITVVIANIFEMIIPKGNLKKYIKIVLGIYIVFSIISPFLNKKELYSLDIEKEINSYTSELKYQNNNEITKKVDKNLEEVYSNVFKEKITKTIEKYGFNVRSVLIDASFNTNDDNVGIKKISIVLSSKNDNYKNKDINKERNKEKTNEISEKHNSIEINPINKVEINVSNRTNNNLKEKDDTIKISKKDIYELIKYLSDYYDIEKNIFDVKAY